jgi:hypothetical protein
MKRINHRQGIILSDLTLAIETEKVDRVNPVSLSQKYPKKTP